MPKSAFPRTSKPSRTQIGSGALSRTLAETGQSPSMSILIKPLSGNGIAMTLERFLSYKFSSSILIPVDTFSFEYASPDAAPLTDYINDGDLAVLSANDVALSTGIIDTTETETDPDHGEVSRLMGRDLMAQLEDQAAVSLTSKPIYANSISLEAGVKLICQDTKITKFAFRDCPKVAPLLQSDPGESKLSVLQRFLEPYNVVAWAGPSGELIVGKPNMSQKKKGNLICTREDRFSNVLHARVTRSSTTIANIVAAIWTGQEKAQTRAMLSQNQIVYNNAPGPTRLRQYGYLVPKAVVFSNPNAEDSQGQSGVNALAAYGANVIQAMAKSQIARENVKEIVFQCVVQGHYNDLGEPYTVDTVYHIDYDRGNLYEDMYLFEVDYELTPDNGQRTTLSFCRFGSIVADIRAPGA